MPRKALFLHIQKTAGTSIIALTREHYGDSIIHHGDHVGHQPEDFSDTLFVSGHFGFEFARCLMKDRYCFTFLRDPIERILSFYYFLRTQDPSLFPMYRFAHEHTLEEFLQAGFDNPLARPRIWNNQTWQLAYGGYSDPKQRMPDDFKREELLELAIKHLSEFSHVGFTDTVAADQKIILKALGITPPEKEMVANANPGRKTIDNLPASTLTLLNELTELDQELYHHACETYKKTRLGSLLKKPLRLFS